jgi:hypothetical protein
MIKHDSVIARMLKVIGLVKEPSPPVELSVPDQLVLRALFFAKSLTAEHVIGAVQGEWGASRLEVLGSLRTLEQVRLVKRQRKADSEDTYSSTETAKELAAHIPARPTVPMNLYI